MISRRDIRHLIDQVILKLADWDFLKQEAELLANHPEVIGGPPEVQQLVEALKKIAKLEPAESEAKLNELRQTEFGDRYPSPEERSDLLTELVRVEVFHYLHGQPEGIFQLIDQILIKKTFEVPQCEALEVLGALKDYHTRYGETSLISEEKVNTETQRLILGILFKFIDSK